ISPANPRGRARPLTMDLDAKLAGVGLQRRSIDDASRGPLKGSVPHAKHGGRYRGPWFAGPVKGSVPHAKHGGRYRRPKAGGRGLGAIRAETGHQQLHLLGDPPVLRLEMLADTTDQTARVRVHHPVPAAAEMEFVGGLGRLSVRGSSTVETGLLE